MHIDQTEKRYIYLSVGMVVVFGILLAISSVAYSINLVTPQTQVNPAHLTTPGATAYDGFAEPLENRVRMLAPNQYEAYIIGYATKGWKWEPNEVRVPVGSTVTFYVTSGDVMHGFKVQNTNINVMVIPGHISKVSVTFDEAGEYPFICHEYCGILHHNMFGKIIVE